MIGKTRKPKFELHLKIYDLNNVPLVTGNSYIKWHLVHSMHAEHRGRTTKCPIINHRVDFAFHKHVPSIRISVDKANNLAECPLELEIVQEFGGGAEKMSLGYVRLNLSEYVEESESFVKDVTSPPRKRSSSTGLTPSATAAQELNHDNKAVEDGIVRRYLMQDSKVNSTLRVGILMFQLDGERNFIAPPLRSAPVFGGIAGLIPPDQMEEDMNQLPSIAKPRDASEIQDLYRRTLAASWYSQPQELPADECIEDIFGGGNGWCTKRDVSAHDSGDEDLEHDAAGSDKVNDGTLRPSDFRRMQQQQQSHSSSRFHFHRRSHSGASDKSVSTVKGGGGGGRPSTPGGGPTFTTRRSNPRLRQEASSSSSNGGGHREREDELSHHHSRASSFASLAPTLGSDSSSSGGPGGGRERDGAYNRLREVKEADARDDLVAWTLPGVTA